MEKRADIEDQRERERNWEQTEQVFNPIVLDFAERDAVYL